MTGASVLRWQIDQSRQGIVHVAVDVELTPDHLANDALLVDHEGDPLRRQPAADPGNPESRSDPGVRIAEKRKRQAVLLCEGSVGLCGVCAYADNFGVVGSDLLDAVAESLRFAGSARGEVLWEEVHDQVALPPKVRRPKRRAIRQLTEKIRSLVAYSNHPPPSRSFWGRVEELKLLRGRSSTRTATSILQHGPADGPAEVSLAPAPAANT